MILYNTLFEDARALWQINNATVLDVGVHNSHIFWLRYILTNSNSTVATPASRVATTLATLASRASSSSSSSSSYSYSSSYYREAST
jgi:hypothetical protein